MTDTTISIGDIVEDREGTSPTGVVVNRPPVPISDWHVHGTPVSVHNPDYPEDDCVIIILFEDVLAEHYPEYTGGRSLLMRQLNADDVESYAFPERRLRPVGEREPIELRLEEMDPSPFHARNFDADANRQYINTIRDRGQPKRRPLVRDRGDRYELLNGHKRVWASYVAGLKAIEVDVVYLDDFSAARYWAEQHLEGYDSLERQAALGRLRDRFGDRAHAIERMYTPSEQRQQAHTDGGRSQPPKTKPTQS